MKNAYFYKKKMKKLLLLLLFLIGINSQGQSVRKKWINDVNEIEMKLKNHDYLFHSITKIQFSKKINILKNNDLSDNENLNYWYLSKILQSFKDYNLNILRPDMPSFAFRCTKFREGIFITNVHREYDSLKASQLLAINGIPISKILSRITNYSNTNPLDLINNKSLLNLLNIAKTDTVSLTVITPDIYKKNINLPFIDNIEDGYMDSLMPEKTPFYKKKDNRWFWSYGINYGQQLYFKQNVGLSKEYFAKMRDSLGLTSRELADRFRLHLQLVYDAPNFDEFTDKFIAKFKKRRYKRLFIDLRGNAKGSLWTSKRMIGIISKHKRLKRRRKVYIFIDKKMTSSAIATVLEFQKRTRVKLVGEGITHTANDFDKIKKYYFKNTNLEVNYPSEKLSVVTLKPDYYVDQTLYYYKNGFDAVMQYVLDLTR